MSIERIRNKTANTMNFIIKALTFEEYFKAEMATATVLYKRGFSHQEAIISALPTEIFLHCTKIYKIEKWPAKKPPHTDPKNLHNTDHLSKLLGVKPMLRGTTINNMLDHDQNIWVVWTT
mmetsp:Transcript_48734/g.146854  ORF Transcript_48734/g.146854 Transcript_48734/m.146854 type:complete len:120 (-) Transcript_48734:216-575(-)